MKQTRYKEPLPLAVIGQPAPVTLGLWNKYCDITAAT